MERVEAHFSCERIFALLLGLQDILKFLFFVCIVRMSYRKRMKIRNTLYLSWINRACYSMN